LNTRSGCVIWHETQAFQTEDNYYHADLNDRCDLPLDHLPLDSIKLQYPDRVADPPQHIFSHDQHVVARLRELLEADFEDTEQVVRLSAEESTPLQKVISVMDIIRNAGFEKIFVATEVAAGEEL